MRFDIRKNNGKTTGKRYSFEMSRTGLIGISAALVLAMVWVFIFGVLIGRGYSPEQAVPELSSLMPGQAEASAEPDAVEIIQPEQLEFMDRLSEGTVPPPPADPPLAEDHAGDTGDTGDSGDSSATDVRDSLEQAIKVKQPVPAPKEKAGPGSKDVAVADPEPKKTQTPPPPKDPAPDSTPNTIDPEQMVYNYVYQVASFKDKEAAARFNEKVKGLGLDARIDKAESSGSTWYRVNVHFQGKPEDTRGMKDKLKTLGVDKPIMRAKDPA